MIIEGEDYARKVLKDIDKIVIAAGMKSYIPFNIKSKTTVYTVSDALKIGKTQDAIHKAYELAASI